MNKNIKLINLSLISFGTVSCIGIASNCATINANQTNKIEWDNSHSSGIDKNLYTVPESNFADFNYDNKNDDEHLLQNYTKIVLINTNPLNWYETQNYLDTFLARIEELTKIRPFVYSNTSKFGYDLNRLCDNYENEEVLNANSENRIPYIEIIINHSKDKDLTELIEEIKNYDFIEKIYLNINDLSKNISNDQIIIGDKSKVVIGKKRLLMDPAWFAPRYRWTPFYTKLKLTDESIKKGNLYELIKKIKGVVSGNKLFKILNSGYILIYEIDMQNKLDKSEIEKISEFNEIEKVFPNRYNENYFNFIFPIVELCEKN
ncbi:hypothetical protein [Mycoplasmopsis iners]|uniref:hypothetical protein n=1 Tax=Mycoplasmopsis iners TaxID=76630 RepID=UPI000496BB63|nr:hypothetical protein [Mycoplasmopsis iners]